MDDPACPLHSPTSEHPLAAGPSDLERARAAAVALEQECAVLADALSALTHEWAPFGAQNTAYCACGARVDHAVHRTPRWLRQRYGLGAS